MAGDDTGWPTLSSEEWTTVAGMLAARLAGNVGDLALARR